MTGMTIIRRLAASVGIALAIVGLLACLGGVAGTWAVKVRAQTAAASVFTAADGAFEFIGTRLARVTARLEAIRPRVQGLAGLAQRLQSIELEGDVKAAIESLREHLDAGAAELKASEGALDPIEAVARGVQSAAAAFAASSVRASDVAEFAGEVATAASRLDALRAKLLEVRERRLLAREFAAMCLAEAADLDTRLLNLTGRIGALGARISTARASYADTGRRVHTWIALGALVVAGALLWFAASQVCVLQRVATTFRTP